MLAEDRMDLGIENPPSKARPVPSPMVVVAPLLVETMAAASTVVASAAAPRAIEVVRMCLRGC